MEGREVAEELGPQGAVVLVVQEILVGRQDEPGGAFEFFFELSFLPAGVADEGADESSRALGVSDGVVDGESGGKVKAVVFLPKGGESEVASGDGAALVDLKLCEG